MKKLYLSITFALASATCFANFEQGGYSMFFQDGGIYLSSVTGIMPEEVIIPDSIEYEGVKYPVTKLGGDLFM